MEIKERRRAFDHKRAKELRDQGRTVISIANHFGVTKGAVQYALKRQRASTVVSK